MNDAYVECLVKRKMSVAAALLRNVLIMLTVCFVLAGFIFSPAFIVAVACGIGGYFAYLNSDVEYEYLYLDREVSIDKIMAKTKRKRVANYAMDTMEICAPINSWHLDEYKNRNVKAVDYSSGRVEQPDVRYVMYVEGGQKIIFEPNEEMIKAMKNVAPRKVFND